MHERICVQVVTYAPDKQFSKLFERPGQTFFVQFFQLSTDQEYTNQIIKNKDFSLKIRKQEGRKLPGGGGGWSG